MTVEEMDVFNAVNAIVHALMTAHNRATPYSHRMILKSVDYQGHSTAIAAA
jgi:hypothetical protein